MGHKTHPYGFRLGIIKDWKAHWYARNSSSYRGLVSEDLSLRDSIRDEYRSFSDAGIARVEIDRGRPGQRDQHPLRPARDPDRTGRGTGPSPFGASWSRLPRAGCN